MSITIHLWLLELRRRYIVEPITRDPRETRASNTRLGIDVSWMFRHAVGGGQASFDEALGELSSRDRVMLYALLLQKGHVEELTHAFDRLLSEPHLLHRATVLDIGCGPFTSGLALANASSQDIVFRYFGVDTSRAMCELGRELAEAAKHLGGLNPLTDVTFDSSTDDIDFGPPRAGWTIVVLSYLLASPTIDTALLVRQVADACDRIGPGPVALLYTNAARPEARAAFPDFRDRLVAAGFTLRIEDLETLTDSDKPRDIHYALFVRLAGEPISLEAFEP